jgi:putative solute:sodium symporter small subunit
MTTTPNDPAQRARLLAARARHWRKTRRLTALLLLAWSVATFATVFYARELSNLVMFGWPVSFYLAAQGTILGYLAIVGYYAYAMRRYDRQFTRELG